MFPFHRDQMFTLLDPLKGHVLDTGDPVLWILDLFVERTIQAEPLAGLFVLMEVNLPCVVLDEVTIAPVAVEISFG